MADKLKRFKAWAWLVLNGYCTKHYIRTSITTSCPKCWDIKWRKSMTENAIKDVRRLAKLTRIRETLER